MKTNLSIQIRKNRDGELCVAPSIEEQTLWDIPVKEWTPAVQQALLTAYETGWRHARTAASRALDYTSGNKEARVWPKVGQAPRNTQ